MLDYTWHGKYADKTNYCYILPLCYVDRPQIASNPHSLWQWNILVLSELRKAFQGIRIVLSCAYLPHLFETSYRGLHKVE